MKDGLADVYSTIITENAKKQSMTVGKIKNGDELEGPTKKVIPNSGPESVKNLQKAEEAPEGLNPVKKGKKIKETTMSFADLYNKVMLKEEDIESSEFNQDIGDFPADASEAPGAEADQGDLAEPETEGEVESKEALFRQLADVFTKLADLETSELEEVPMDEVPEAGADQVGSETPMTQDAAPQQGMKAPVGEAVSAPEPKEFKANISQFQAPNKLGRTGVKVFKRKVATTGNSQKKDGTIKDAPKGFKPGDKGMMKVGGSGAAQEGKNASALE